MGAGMSTEDDAENVLSMNSEREWTEKLKEAEKDGKVIVVDFTATWCGPCKVMAPLFAQLAKEHTDMIFLKVDVDKLKGVARDWDVQAMPTFIFIKNRKTIDKIVGANKSELQRKVAMYAAGG